MTQSHKNTLDVLVATPLGQFGRGGIDRLTDSILDALQQRGYLGIQACRLVTRGPGSIFWSPIIFARALAQLLIARCRSRVDLLHIQLSVRGSTYRKFVLASLAARLGIPYVVHLHGAPFDLFWLAAGKYLRQAIKRLFMGSAEIVVLGRYWERFLIDILPELHHKITVLPNATPAINHDREPSTDGRVRITFLGELGPRKGTPQLIDSLRNLAPRTDWAATLAGNGEIKESLQQIQQLGLTGRVRVSGWLGPTETTKLLQETDIFVLPSFAENMPMTILESFAVGAAVISTPVGAIPELIDDGRNGLLVPAGDVNALTIGLRRLLDDPQLRQRLGENARYDHAKHYEIGGYVERLGAIWWRAARDSNR